MCLSLYFFLSEGVCNLQHNEENMIAPCYKSDMRKSWRPHTPSVMRAKSSRVGVFSQVTALIPADSASGSRCLYGVSAGSRSNPSHASCVSLFIWSSSYLEHIHFVFHPPPSPLWLIHPQPRSCIFQCETGIHTKCTSTFCKLSWYTRDRVLHEQRIPWRFAIQRHEGIPGIYEATDILTHRRDILQILMNGTHFRSRGLSKAFDCLFWHIIIPKDPTTGSSSIQINFGKKIIYPRNLCLNSWPLQFIFLIKLEDIDWDVYLLL